MSHSVYVQGQNVWDPNTMSWVKETQPSGGGGGGAATIADGADVAEGSTTDIAVTSDSNGTVSGKLRGLVKIFASVWDSVNGRLKVDGSGVTQPVSGSVTVNTITGFALEAGHLATIDTSTAASKTDLDAILVDTNDIETNTAPLLVSSAGGFVQQDSNATIAKESGGNLATLAGVVTAARAAVNPIAGQAGVQGASGTVTALTQRVVLATDVALPAGTNQIGHVIADSPTTATVTQVNPAWRQSVVLLAANASRKEGMLINQTDAPFFLMEGAAASDIVYAAVVPPRGRYQFDVTAAMNGWWNQLPTQGQVLVTERA